MDAVKSFAIKHLKEGAIYAVLFILLAIIVIQEPSFLSLRNLSNILTQSSVRVIIALGVAGLIVTQGTDLSAGRQVGLAAVISATLLQSMDNVNKVFPSLGEIPILAVIISVCLIGAIIGLVNGVIVAYLKVTPFIATLGTMIIVYGINSLYYDSVGASPIAGFDERFTTFTQALSELGIFGSPTSPSTPLSRSFLCGYCGIKPCSAKTFLRLVETQKRRKCRVLTCL